jgi:hypothetical protein
VFWETAFQDYFLDRIQLRYLAPIELLQQLDAKQGEGFAIVSIHCSLIEFLESTFKARFTGMSGETKTSDLMRITQECYRPAW